MMLRLSSIVNGLRSLPQVLKKPPDYVPIRNRFFGLLPVLVVTIAFAFRGTGRFATVHTTSTICHGG